MNITEEMRVMLDMLAIENARLRQIVIGLGQEALCAIDGRQGYHTSMQNIARRSAELLA